MRLFGRLDILSNMSALPARRALCIYARLRALNTKRYEISGLVWIKKPFAYNYILEVTPKMVHGRGRDKSRPYASP